MLKTKLPHLSTIVLVASILLGACGTVKEPNPPTETIAPTATNPVSTESPAPTNTQIPPTTISPVPTAGNVLQSVTATGIRVDLIGVTYDGKNVNIKYCITLPDATDWFPSSISITANGQTTSDLGFALAGSKHDPATFAAYRCYITTDSNAQPAESFSFSIGVIGKDGTLAGDCPRAQQTLASQYPGLKFACGGVTEGVGGGGGSFYNLIQRPDGWSDQKVDQIIMDAMQQNIQGPWTFAITR